MSREARRELAFAGTCFNPVVLSQTSFIPISTQSPIVSPISSMQSRRSHLQCNANVSAVSATTSPSRLVSRTQICTSLTGASVADQVREVSEVDYLEVPNVLHTISDLIFDIDFQRRVRQNKPVPTLPKYV